MITVSVGISLSALLPKEVLPQTLPPTFSHTAVLWGCIYQCCILSELPPGSDWLLQLWSPSPAMWSLCSSSQFLHGLLSGPLLWLSLLLHVLCSQWAEAGIRCFLPPLFHCTPLSHFFPERRLRAIISAWHCLVNRTLGAGLSQLSFIARMLFR